MVGDETEKQFIALTAQLKQVQINNDRLRREIRQHKADTAKKHDKKKNNNLKWAWKNNRPKQGEKMKVFEGKTYHWCKHHKKWTLHKANECRLVCNGQPVNPPNNPPNNNMRGLAALLELDESITPFDEEL